MSFLTAPNSLFLASLSALCVGALGSLLLRRKDDAANGWGNGFAILASLLGLASSVSVIWSGAGFAYQAHSSLPLLSFALNVDRLSAFFIFIISLVALCASVYALGYAKHFFKKYNIGALGFFYNCFIAGMLLVVSVSNALLFLIVWEIMSLASYFLVIYENREKENVKAGSLYFIMTHVGTAFIILAFLLLYSASGSFDFAAMQANLGNMTPLVKSLVFLFALVGFGTKAGIIPLHIWLPSAHPAAPTHVSALMSGVMIKTGIYMMVRIFFGILPDPPLWWGVAVLVIGAVSAFLGVLYALTEHDIKRLLAYHSIENIGIILLGLGSSLVFVSLGMKELALLGLIAALFHTLNHAVFKGLLFLGAGAVISKTHTRNMEEYGGLIKRMPQTAFFFLAGAMAISALPPLNGFASEWLTYQSLFGGMLGAGAMTRWVFVLAAGSLALTGGLAAACFVKAFGATFLARPRSEEAEHATEVGLSLRLGMGVLALLTLVIGLAAGKISSVIAGIANSLSVFGGASAPFAGSYRALTLTNGFANVSMPGIFLGLAIALGLGFLGFALTGRRKVNVGRTWDCGSDLSPRMEITATGFSRSIILIFKGILKPSHQTSSEYKDSDMRYFPESHTVTFETEDVYRKYFYHPLQNLVNRISAYAKRVQSGNLNVYVLYLFLILVVLLLAIGA